MAAFRLLFLLLALAASCNSTAAASVIPVAAGDEDLQLRQEAMAQAITVISRHRPETSDAEKLKWALGVVNLEAQRWKPIFRAVSTVLESGVDDGTKEEAFAQAKEELNRDLGQEGPNALNARSVGISHGVVATAGSCASWACRSCPRMQRDRCVGAVGINHDVVPLSGTD
ncbi:uncharacterized protein LOC119280295 [Triticum dicoccoides]|uniref:uncharacterized protein LOC119280295 n=1 Tax=Triticum dicoccoides TaxID=85692 RepID=UPI0018904CED|nr:uncharacterized protein LOC119280295 [Triticum dicoccoides]